MNQTEVVLDVGKTFSKLSLWGTDGELIAREVYRNQLVEEKSLRALDTEGIENWMIDTLRAFSSLGHVRTIIPVTHGAAAAIVRDGARVCPVLDYECPIPEDVRAAYDAARDEFRLTGSPRLPDGLNLGAQLYWLASMYPECFADGSTILTYPQYWSWLLSGVAATEVTSLGCHGDLWFPELRRPSRLAETQGWAEMFAPIRRADAVLGTLTPEWVELTRLPATTQVRCGIHDSNASHLASRGLSEIGDREFTTLSTGTWFVAMRSPSRDTTFRIDELPEHRDCYTNVDINGDIVPTAKFMGGREISILTDGDHEGLDDPSEQERQLNAAARVTKSKSFALPAYVSGVGPFPDCAGRWIRKPADRSELQAAACLYAALIANTCLSLIDSKDRVLIEGRYSKADVFVRALASLRPDVQILVSDAEHDVSYGALCLSDNVLLPKGSLRQIRPLDFELGDYAEQWQAETESH